uniref:Uncharacterized protein LOC111107737 isoform X1 n=1 Tax=Crassostrea virginica TaxID=6565 RepID=A0A8B8B5V5_CRAVI|nr:uncharacterized protein LOC111107737 isoform X1 [Crassostrea virginica]
MGSSSSKADSGGGTNAAHDGTTSQPNDCDNYIFNSTGCEIITKGKLLLVLDTINTTLQTYFSCFCDLVLSRLNNTNVTSEVLSGDQNTRSCQIQSDPLHVEENILKDGLRNLSEEFSPKEKEAGMAIILSDQGLTSDNFTDIPADREPFLFIVNVGQNESESRRTCFRQNRFISEMEKINDFGLEIEKIGCDEGKEYMQANCPKLPSTNKPALEVNSSLIGMPLVVLSVVGALVIVALIIVYLVFRPRCRQREEPNKNTMKESPEMHIGSGRYQLPSKHETRLSTNLKNNDVYNVLWEKEHPEADKENENNYHHIDLNFVDQNIDPSLYDTADMVCEDRKNLFTPPA